MTFEYVECSEEDLATTEAGLEEIAAAYGRTYDCSEDEESADFTAIAIGYGSLANGFWLEVMPTVPVCGCTSGWLWFRL